MNFDSIIPILILLAFFVLPTLFKQVKARKNKKAPTTKPKKPSLFGRLGEQVQRFVQELEQQAQNQKKASNQAENAWEMFAEDEDFSLSDEDLGQKADITESEPVVIQQTTVAQTAGNERQKRFSKKGLSVQPPDICLSSVPRRKYRLKDNPLQNAMVWSEILSRPVALRGEENKNF